MFVVIDMLGNCTSTILVYSNIVTLQKQQADISFSK